MSIPIFFPFTSSTYGRDPAGARSFETAADRLDIFKGGEIVSYVVLKSGEIENIHILQIYLENPPPEKLNEILKSITLNFTLGVDQLKS